MANRTIKNKLKNLYNECKDNLSTKSIQILNDIFRLDRKSIYDYRANVIKSFVSEAHKIIQECEATIPIEKLNECDYTDIATSYCVAIALLEEDIKKVVKTCNKNIYELNLSLDNISFNIIEKYKAAINKVKLQFNITGEVLDFLMNVPS